MKKAIEWMADNHVASNLLMIFIIIVGVFSFYNAKIEVFPEVTMDMVTIEVMYPGASPDEVEQSICVKIEEQIEGIDGIASITSTANENVGIVFAELELGEDLSDIKDKIKSEIDRITIFPENAEKAVVKEVLRKRQVIQVAVSGKDISDRVLKDFARKIKDDLLTYEEITQAVVVGTKNDEITINVAEEALDAYGLSFDFVSTAIKLGSLDLPAGNLETEGGIITLRTKGLGYTKEDYENIPLRTSKSGHIVYLKDIAEVVDGFEDADFISEFDGKKAALVQVYRVGDQNAVDVADRVKEYISENENKFPLGISVNTWLDQSRILEDRIDLLLRNARAGLFLVIFVLALFLDIRLALWVASGIAISFLGAFLSMILFDVSINMISLFAFILVLGIVVDDAIVVGENIFAQREKKLPPLKAAKEGVLGVSTPVFFSVSTSIAAFTPLLFVDGFMGKFMYVMPVIVISVLVFSLIESMLVLPSHLATLKEKTKNSVVELSYKITHKVDDALDRFIKTTFTKYLSLALDKRYVTQSISVALILISLGFLQGGIVKFDFFPKVESDNITSFVQMPEGTTLEQTSKIIKRIENIAREIEKEFEVEHKEKYGTPLFKHVSSTVGDQPMVRLNAPNSSGSVIYKSNIGEINIELQPAENRDLLASTLVKKWRERVGEIPGVEVLNFSASIMSSGADIQYQLTMQDFEMLKEAVEVFKDSLKNYTGIVDIRDDFQEGKYELKLKLKKSAIPLGLSLSDLARQVRSAFYGLEADRIQRGEDEVKVMVRYPKESRVSLYDVEHMKIRTKTGATVPFSEVAEVDYGYGYSALQRSSGKRVIMVTAAVDQAKTSVSKNDLNDKIKGSIIPEIQKKYPGFNYEIQGEQKEQQKAASSIVTGFIIAIFVIYTLLAIPFKSYIQPLIVMSAIPFGLIGAVWGHLLMNYQMSMISIFGIVALAGIVVNDSLVLIDFYNKEVAAGKNVRDAVISAAQRRFRPILLTSLTTFAGLLPMLFEQSMQAKFLIPMAISLGFGVIFATVICLLFVPAGVLIIDDLKKLVKPNEVA
jgi:multidrug efflux pump subunit AcrB